MFPLKGPQAPAPAEPESAEVEAEEDDEEKTVRQQRNLNQDHDIIDEGEEEEYAESQQWSIISLFSRAHPQRT